MAKETKNAAEKNFVEVCMNCGSSNWNYLIEREGFGLMPRGSDTISQYTINCHNCGYVGTWVELNSKGQIELQETYIIKKK